MNFITEHKIEQYTDLTAKIAEIQTESEQAADALKSAEKRLADMAVLIKNKVRNNIKQYYNNNIFFAYLSKFFFKDCAHINCQAIIP